MPVRVFDAYGTLFDVHSAVMRHAADVGPDAHRLAEVWRQKQLEYTWVLTLMGAYESFEALTERALDTALASLDRVPVALRPRLIEAYAQLSAYPEVPETLARLKAAGDCLIVFSNANRSMLGRALRASGIGELIDAVVSVDEVRLFKPHPATYRLLDPWRQTAAAEPTMFYSANRWDIAGARSQGLGAIWVNRRGATEECPGFAPEATASDLAGAVRLRPSASPPA